MLRISEQLFQSTTLQVAERLLGMRLGTCVDGIETVGRIVEVEAYGPEGDQACHAARGITKRTQVMFGQPGRCYVYLIYGAHFCVNVVTEREGVGAAVLIRAIEPESGIEVMRHRRGLMDPRQLANGPGKLCSALKIDGTFNGENFMHSERIWLTDGSPHNKETIYRSPRIGITKSVDLPWRFYLSDNPHVSAQRNRTQISL